MYLVFNFSLEFCIIYKNIVLVICEFVDFVNIDYVELIGFKIKDEFLDKISELFDYMVVVLEVLKIVEWVLNWRD